MDRLKRAKEYLAQGDVAYGKAAAEIRAWLDEGIGRTQQMAADELGISQQRVSQILELHKGSLVGAEKAKKTMQHARRALREDPAAVLANMEPEEIERVASSIEQAQRQQEGPWRASLKALRQRALELEVDVRNDARRGLLTQDDWAEIADGTKTVWDHLSNIAEIEEEAKSHGAKVIAIR